MKHFETKKINRLKIITKKSASKILKFTFKFIFNVIPIRNNKIVVSSYYGKGYGDNGKYIVEEIIKQNIECDIVWLIKKELMGTGNFPEKVRCVEYGSIKGFYELSTSKIWIDNCRKSFYTYKRKKQFYIQTWHGGIGVKLVEQDVIDKLSPYYVKNAKNDSKMADLFISNSKWCTDYFKKSFWYKGEILECGTPRVDVLFNASSAIKSKVFDYYNIEKNKKLLLYAPSFREKKDITSYTLTDFEKLLEALENKFGDKWIVLVKLHPNIINQSNLITNHSNVIDVTAYDDTQELLVATNVLLTDFSSIMFEYSYIKKPVFMFVKDYNDYFTERGFVMDIESLPFSISFNFQELMDNIYDFNYESYYKNVNNMHENFGVKEEGKSCVQIVDKIKELML